MIVSLFGVDAANLRSAVIGCKWQIPDALLQKANEWSRAFFSSELKPTHIPSVLATIARATYPRRINRVASCALLDE